MPAPHTAAVVLFVCEHGAAKSVIAAEHLRRLAAERGVALDRRAAGLVPDAEFPPHVVAGLLADGLEVPRGRPRALAPDDLAAAGCIVSMGCDLGALPTPGAERWDDLPLVSDGYGPARDAIVARVSTLLARLPSGADGGPPAGGGATR
jgi:arsenate reductase (thioredoxin)